MPRRLIHAIGCIVLEFGLAVGIVAGGDIVIGPGVVINDNVGGNFSGPGGVWTSTPVDQQTQFPNYAEGYNVIVEEGGEVKGLIYGARAYGWANAGATTTRNTVTIRGVVGNTAGINGGNSYSRTGINTSTYNSAVVSGNGFVAGTVTGGVAYTASGTAAATGNTAIIGDNGRVGTDVSGGTVSSQTGAVQSTDNTVIIKDNARVDGIVYGGSAQSDSGISTATGNAVSLSGSPVFGAGSDLYGGGGRGGAGSDFFTDNTLDVQDYKGSAVKSVRNFERYAFTFPASQAGTGDPVLAVTDKIILGDGARGSTITANTLGGTDPVQPGGRVTLMDAGAGGTLELNGFNQERAEGKHGALLYYDWLVETADNKLVVRLEGVDVDPKAEALSKGFLSGLSGVNQGASLVAGLGMSNAVSATLIDQGVEIFRLGQDMSREPDVVYENGGERRSRFGVFAAVSGSRSRYRTGSHVDMSGIAFTTGLAWGADPTPGHLTLGVFLEYGRGFYDTHMSFPEVASVHGSGDARHIGGGLLGRMDFSGTEPRHGYLETSLRIGEARNRYRNDDLVDLNGQGAAYASSSLYYGSHLGAGYIADVGGIGSLDLSGKLFLNRYKGDAVTLSGGEGVEFEDIDSIRLRLGGRFLLDVSKFASLYAGAAGEYEFDGDARASVAGFPLDTPSLGGVTGVGELGIARNPVAGKGFYADMGVQGYVGKRTGVAGNLRFGWIY